MNDNFLLDPNFRLLMGVLCGVAFLYFAGRLVVAIRSSLRAPPASQSPAKDVDA
jgi:hypothetical protein